MSAGITDLLHDHFCKLVRSRFFLTAPDRQFDPVREEGIGDAGVYGIHLQKGIAHNAENIRISRFHLDDPIAVLFVDLVGGERRAESQRGESPRSDERRRLGGDDVRSGNGVRRRLARRY